MSSTLRDAIVLVALAGCAGPRAEERAPPSQADATPTNPAPGKPTLREPEPAKTPMGPWEGGREIASNDGAWRVVFKLGEKPIPRGETFGIDAWVFAADDPKTPRTDVSLSVDAAMPEHGHGMNRVPTVAALGDGRFRAEGLLFHMPGRWELYFDVTRGPITERAQANVDLE